MGKQRSLDEGNFEKSFGTEVQRLLVAPSQSDQATAQPNTKGEQQ